MQHPTRHWLADHLSRFCYPTGVCQLSHAHPEVLVSSVEVVVNHADTPDAECELIDCWWHQDFARERELLEVDG